MVGGWGAGKEREMAIPQWLESLLCAKFFVVCSVHKVSPRSECNMYCLDCAGDAFCLYCKDALHRRHKVIQIRRSSYHDVVRVSEIHRFLDVAGIQPYVINSARVLFLNERPQPRGSSKAGSGSSGGHACEVCRRSLLDSFPYCSLGCKVAGMKKDGNSGISGIEDEEDRRDPGEYRPPSTPPPPRPMPNTRRRKGIPQRAPLGT